MILMSNAITINDDGNSDFGNECNNVKLIELFTDEIKLLYI